MSQSEVEQGLGRRQVCPQAQRAWREAGHLEMAEFPTAPGEEPEDVGESGPENLGLYLEDTGRCRG